jgi:hypothetical protein
MVAMTARDRVLLEKNAKRNDIGETKQGVEKR